MKRDWHVILNLFASSSRLQKKRAYLTIAAIAWGTVAILLLLAFGEGLKRQMDKNRRSTGENLAVMWPDVTTKPWKGLPAARSSSRAWPISSQVFPGAPLVPVSGPSARIVLTTESGYWAARR